MRYVILITLLTSFSLANEINRMESIVLDIEKLRSDYSVCLNQLDTQKKQVSIDDHLSLQAKLKIATQKIKEHEILLEKKEAKNLELALKIDSLIAINEKSKKKDFKLLLDKEKKEKNKYKKSFIELEEKYKKVLKEKESMMISLENGTTSDKRTIIKPEKACIEENPFPSLMMKNISTKNDSIKKSVLETKNTLEVKVRSKALTYRLNKESNIHDGIDGKVIFIWENKRSFTSNETTQNWIKVSGYFIDKKFQKADQDLWIKKLNTSKR